MVIELPFKLSVPAASVVKLVSAVVPPIASPKVVAPDALIVSPCAPLTVDVSITPCAVKAVSMPNVTASFRVMLPDVVIAPPLSTSVPAESVVRLVNAVVPPIALPKVVAPEALIVSERAPLTVDVSVTAWPVRTVSIPNVTASFRVVLPDVVIEPPLSTSVPAESVVRLVNAVVPPTTPPKLVAPEALIVSDRAPSTVDDSVTPCAVRTVSISSAIASFSVMLLVAVIAPPLSTSVPAASVVKLVNAVAPPTTPPKVVAPEALIVRL